MSSEGHLPAFDGATGWLNSSALTAADVTGKVVLVDFWTYTCINWLRTLAYVRAWFEKYQRSGVGHRRRAHALSSRSSTTSTTSARPQRT